jgi:hypothetical protein
MLIEEGELQSLNVRNLLKLSELISLGVVINLRPRDAVQLSDTSNPVGPPVMQRTVWRVIPMPYEIAYFHAYHLVLLVR